MAEELKVMPAQQIVVPLEGGKVTIDAAIAGQVIVVAYEPGTDEIKCFCTPNRVMGYGLLEAAKDFVRQQVDAATKSGLVIPRGFRRPM